MLFPQKNSFIDENKSLHKSRDMYQLYPISAGY